MSDTVDVWRSVLDFRHGTESEQSLFMDLADILLRITGTDETSVLIRRGDSLVFVATANRGGVRRDLAGTTVPIDGTVVGLVIRTGSPHVDVPRRTIASTPNADGSVRLPTAVLAVPIHGAEQVVGVLSAVSFDPAYEIEDVHLRDTEQLARILAGALSVAARSEHDVAAGVRGNGEPAPTATTGRAKLRSVIARLEVCDDATCERVARLLEISFEMPKIA